MLRIANDPAGNDLWPTAEEAEHRTRAEKEAALARIAELERKLRGET